MACQTVIVIYRDGALCSHLPRRKWEVSFKKAVDETKDQSYAPYSMTQDELAHAFPAWGTDKKQVREIALKLVSNAKAGKSGYLLRA